MPTGYTADIHDGKDVDFPDFAMNCARRFGEYVRARGDAPIPDEIEVSDYHTVQLAEAEAEIARIEAWDETEANRQAALSYNSEHREYMEEMVRMTALRRRYEAMLAKVNTWTPPTEEHQALKDFMVEQLTTSIAADCSTSYFDVPVRLSGADYKELRLREARWYVSYHTRECEAEQRYAEAGTNWIRALRQSLTESTTESTDT